jgi:hypothetical protein
MTDWLIATWSRLSWRGVLGTQAIGQLIAFLVTFEWGYFGESIHHRSLHYVAMAVYVLILPPLAIGADEAAGRGAPPRIVYPVLLIGNLLTAMAVAWSMQQLYCLWYGISLPETVRWNFPEASVHLSMYWTIALLAYMNKRAAERMLERVQGAELRRVQLDRQLVESRLATAEAQIDPKMLFSALARIKRGFEECAPEADTGLNELIQALRTALTRTTVVNSEGNGP